MASRWRDLGLELKLDDSKLDIIKTNNPQDAEQCCTEMYQRWLRSDLEASREKLTLALQNIDLPERVDGKSETIQ